MDNSTVVAIGLAIYGGLGALAFKDMDAYTRLAQPLKVLLVAISNLSAGAFVASYFIGNGRFSARDGIIMAMGVGAVCWASYALLVLYAWLRNDR